MWLRAGKVNIQNQSRTNTTLQKICFYPYIGIENEIFSGSTG
jgi:hypothetical protein